MAKLIILRLLCVLIVHTLEFTTGQYGRPQLAPPPPPIPLYGPQFRPPPPYQPPPFQPPPFQPPPFQPPPFYPPYYPPPNINADKQLPLITAQQLQQQVKQLNTSHQSLHDQKDQLKTSLFNFEQRIETIEKQINLMVNYENDQYQFIKRLDDGLRNFERSLETLQSKT